MGRLKRYEPEQIILFGSQARGDADEYSDYDIIVIKRTDKPFLERLRVFCKWLISSYSYMDNRRAFHYRFEHPH